MTEKGHNYPIKIKIALATDIQLVWHLYYTTTFVKYQYPIRKIKKSQRDWLTLLNVKLKLIIKLDRHLAAGFLGRFNNYIYRFAALDIAAAARYIIARFSVSQLLLCIVNIVI